jgi:hypothetical protein
MPVITDGDLTTALANTLKLASTADLKPYWAEIVTWANKQAQSDIRTILMGMGYPLGTAEAWDDFAVYNRRQGLYWCGINGRAYVSKDLMASLEKMDCRAELMNLALIEVNGLPVEPVPTVPRVRSGVLAVSATQPHNPLLRNPWRPWQSRDLNP